MGVRAGGITVRMRIFWVYPRLFMRPLNYLKLLFEGVYGLFSSVCGLNA